MKPAPTGIRVLKRLSGIFTAIFLTVHELPADVMPIRLNIHHTGTDFEGSQTFQLDWNAVSNATYVVQQRNTLLPGEPWVGIDAIKPVDTAATYQFAVTATDVTGLSPSSKFLRLAAPQPQIFDVQPTFIDSSDPKAAFYIIGQLLPTNATVIINGHSFLATNDSNGVLRVISLNGLPPGEPVVGTITVIDNNTSNIVATLPVQSPIIYDAALTTEQLQGPPKEPLVGSTSLLMPALMKAKEKANRTKCSSNLRTIGDEDCDDSDDDGSDAFSALRHTKTGHVTLLKRGGEDSSAARGHTKSGHVTLLKRGGDGAANAGKKEFKGHVTLLKRGGSEGDGFSIASSKHTKTGHVTLMKREAAPSGGENDDCDDCDDLDVFAATGELRCQQTDLFIPGVGMDFTWTRTYASRTGPDTAQGHGWDFSYNISMNALTDGLLILRFGDGTAHTFYPNGTNGWARDEYFVEIRDLDNDGMPDVLFADGGKWFFHPFDGSPVAGKITRFCDRNENCSRCEYDGAGRLIHVVDTLDRTNTIAYNSNGQIESVSDFSGRTVRYEYDGNGDLIRCISPAVIGTPTGNDFPGGITNSYSYTSGNVDERLNHNLTSCTDGKGQRWLTAAYQSTSNPASIDFDAVDYIQRGPYVERLRRYRQTPTSANGFAAIKVVLRDAMGNVTESFYDSRLRCVRALEYTGRAPDLFAPTTETSNRPIGKLRPEDPDFYETKWAWNRDSLCTMETRPLGDRTQMIYECDFNPNASPRKKGDCRVLREYACCNGADTDGDGVAETSELAWHFDYNPNFGSPPTARTKRQCLFNLGLKGRLASPGSGGDNTPIIKGSALGSLNSGRKGWDGTIKGSLRGPRQSTSVDGSFTAGSDLLREYDPTKNYLMGDTAIYNGKAYRPGRPVFGNITFETSVVDPRGGLTTASYDTNGNLLHLETIVRKSGQVIAADYNYKEHGRLAAITNAPDANGYRRVDKITYYSSGPQTGYPQSISIDEPGVHLTSAFEYDSRGNVTRVIDPLGNDWLYSYNALDQCITRQTPNNSFGTRTTSSFIYDQNGNITQTDTELRDETGAFLHNVVCRAEFDFLERCTAVADQISPGVFVTNKFFYDANNQLTFVQSPLSVSGVDPHNMVAFEYDERGLLFREIGAPGSGNSPTNQYDYDGNGNCQRVNKIESFTIKQGIKNNYDGMQRLVSVIDPMGNSVDYAYDRNGNCILERVSGELNDAEGSTGNTRLAERRWKYDSLNRCVESRLLFFDPATQANISAGASVTTIAFAPCGQCSSLRNGNGHTTYYSYDTAGRLASVTDPKLDVLSLSYDAGGNLTNIVSTERSDVTSSTTQFSCSYYYDSQGRCVRAVDNVGNTSDCVYDSLNRPVKLMSPRGVLQAFEYDDLGRKLKMWVDSNGDGTMSASELQQLRVFNENSQLTSMTDANTNTAFCAYDSMNRPIETMRADGTHCSLVWSPRSNLLRVQDPNGNVISNRYDLCDRLIARDITPGSGVATTTTFERFAYDGLSRLVAATNAVSHSEFAYDSLGNCTKHIQDGWQMLAAFDANRDRVSLTYPSGLVVSYTYDALDQVQTISSSSGGLPPVTLATYNYEGPGRVGRIIRANNANTRIDWDGMVSPANASDDFGWRRAARVRHAVLGGLPIIDCINKWDRAQNSASRDNHLQGGVDVIQSLRCSYNSLNQLASSFRSSSSGGVQNLIYQLDGNGNRKVVFSDGLAQSYAMEATIPPGDFQMNQYTLTPFAAQAFDENGNLLSRSSSVAQLFYQYDYADRLVAVLDETTGSTVPVATYAYGPLGERVSKTVFSSSPGTPPVTTQYIQDVQVGEVCDDGNNDSGDGCSVLEMRVGGVLGATYVNDRSVARYTGDSHICTAARIVSEIRNGQSYFHHTDDLGNILALTDSNGNVIERYNYDDFGLPHFLTSDGFPMATNASPAGNPFLFHGMEWDEETRFYFEKAWPVRWEGPRVLDPQTGSYINGKNLRSGHYFPWSATAWMHSSSTFAGNNPWSTGAGSHLTRDSLKTYFETGDVPTAEQFGSLIDE